MEGNMVYLDYAATTPFNKEVIKTHEQLLQKYFYNAGMLHVKDEEIIFTSCGSEANNMAIKGIAFQYQNRGKHIITTSIEHSSVYEACKEL